MSKETWKLIRAYFLSLLAPIFLIKMGYEQARERYMLWRATGFIIIGVAMIIGPFFFAGEISGWVLMINIKRLFMGISVVCGCSLLFGVVIIEVGEKHLQNFLKKLFLKLKITRAEVKS